MRFLFSFTFAFLSACLCYGISKEATPSEVLIHPRAEFLMYIDGRFFTSDFMNALFTRIKQSNINNELKKNLDSNEIKNAWQDSKIIFTLNISDAIDKNGDFKPEKIEWLIGWEYGNDTVSSSEGRSKNNILMLNEILRQIFNDVVQQIHVMKHEQSIPEIANMRIEGAKANFSEENTGWTLFDMKINGPGIKDYEILLAISNDCKYALCGSGAAVRRQTVFKWIKKDSKAAMELKRLCNSVANRHLIASSVSFTEDAVHKIGKFFNNESSNDMVIKHLLEKTKRIDLHFVPSGYNLWLFLGLNFKEEFYGKDFELRVRGILERFFKEILASGEQQGANLFPFMYNFNIERNEKKVMIYTVITQNDIDKAFSIQSASTK